jgi:hypothetical protein
MKSLVQLEINRFDRRELCREKRAGPSFETLPTGDFYYIANVRKATKLDK